LGSGFAGFGLGVSGLGVRVQRAHSKYSIVFFSRDDGPSVGMQLSFGFRVVKAQRGLISLNSDLKIESLVRRTNTQNRKKSKKARRVNIVGLFVSRIVKLSSR